MVALIVSVDELPAPIAVGLAVMLTVGAGLAATVTVAVAETFPATPVAVAVYVVVLDGLTACVPPVELSWYELPSDPVTVTPEALVAITVSVDEAPAAMEAGIATTLTVAGLTMLTWVPLQPATINANKRLHARYDEICREILEAILYKCAGSKFLYSILSLEKAHSFPLGVAGNPNAIRPGDLRRTSGSVTQLETKDCMIQGFAGLTVNHTPAIC